MTGIFFLLLVFLSPYPINLTGALHQELHPHFSMTLRSKNLIKLFSNLCSSVCLIYQDPFSTWKGKQITISTNSICIDSKGESWACDHKICNSTKEVRQTFARLSNSILKQLLKFFSIICMHLANMFLCTYIMLLYFACFLCIYNFVSRIHF